MKYSNEGSFKKTDRETLLNTSDFNLSLLDTTKNTVIILVESFGIPIDTLQKRKIFQAFNSYPGKIAGTKKRPIHNTIYAEREEYIPALNLFNQAHYELIYAYGGPSSLYNRKKLIQELGFTQTIFGDSLNDRSMAAKIDSLLGEDPKNKKFIAWTTTDTKFPIKSLSLYSKKLETTEDLIVQLAKAHTKTKFIIVGDHAPIRCNKEIRNAFYRNYVPYFILN
ncbi:MAG: hypothetical protein M0P13_08915 [Fibrobacteraceae bacterium]|nr:hypothetical protein [Fibrobacteraceae bacterium]